MNEATTGDVDLTWAPLDALEKLVHMAVRAGTKPDDAEWLCNELLSVFRAAKGMRALPCKCEIERAERLIKHERRLATKAKHEREQLEFWRRKVG